MKSIQNQYDVVIVGTGAAGLFCALNLPYDCSVLMITKDEMKNSDSYLAQGGICCQLNDEDFDSFYQDTMKAGKYKNDPKAVSDMIKNSRDIIGDLVNFGVDFDKDSDGKLKYTREGGHSEFRILHHKDITGQEIVTKLLDRALEHPNISIRENVMMIDLVEKDNLCRGIVIKNHATEPQVVTAGSVVLATGGIGGLFEQSTNFPHITGDSLAIAIKHGIKLQDISCIQIHPTTLYSKEPGRRFLISESVRGEGAKLYNEEGKRFVNELLPRDIVAGAIREEMIKYGTDHVYLSFEGMPEREILTHFPNIYERCLDEGYDITIEMIPVTPAQHYIMGGILADTNGVTSMKNLYAVGETACNGVHGANRLASNSLLESLVFAKNSAKTIASSQDEDGQKSFIGAEILEYLCKDDYDIKDKKLFEEENRDIVLKEIKKQGEEFYEKWSNL